LERVFGRGLPEIGMELRGSKWGDTKEKIRREVSKSSMVGEWKNQFAVGGRDRVKKDW